VPAAWDDENATEPTWSDPEAWRGEMHQAEDASWASDRSSRWASPSELPTVFEEDLLADEEDWCPGGWLDDWGMEEGET
jgi:hypothetical protein